ncbi:MAG: hypothetical protein D8M57_07975 [Candidatus Scalindua sp. AMX11]|nr:MAG: hypothetical protein DWQ00_11575 [Candidatus Scalindua sp.]NOG85308.1 hypothetical protein [Planctomycetota bacterium]RZV81475.1 MAG: hypothetical protein EX341_10160 [Candidatus Scalindua sp. SCAELEC01]TDE65452.1 MAG: hypothetical protein D8M57_07975 [Candidatus Scalindua sp. AMX11]GJQ59376.1 MAG: hypothetical protein SCALA701_21770 [Candidatus Scalindua sp.]
MEPLDSKPTEMFRKWIMKVDVAFHVIAAIMLLVACGYILFHGALNILNPSRNSVVQLINDVLLALIVLEILWTVNRFLKKKKFHLGPFLAIGVIAGVRRILLIEAQTSFAEHVEIAKLYEIGVSAIVVLVMMVAYYISLKTQKME